MAAIAPERQDPPEIERVAEDVKHGDKASVGSGETRVARSKPTKALPTTRMSFTKQLDVLRAFAIASENGTKPATNARVGEIVDMTAGTVSLANSFFVDTGFLERADGAFLPRPEVVDYNRVAEFGAADAAAKLAPIVRDSWFGRELGARLSLAGSIDEREAVAVLASASQAGSEYKRELSLLLEYLAACGLIEREGTVLRRRPSAWTATLSATTPSAEAPHWKMDSMPMRTENPPIHQHWLRLPRGRRGELRLPDDITQAEWAAVWRQIEALKPLIDAQLELIDETTNPTEGR